MLGSLGQDDAPVTAEQNAAAEMFSIDDYGYGPPGPFQIMEPTYPAPSWLGNYQYLSKALQECSTLCALRGRPYRVVRWGREGSGANGGIPCSVCRSVPGGNRFPRRPCPSCSCGGTCGGKPAPQPLAEFRPDGRHVVFDCRGNPHAVGQPNYVVSRNPFPRTYNPRQPTKLYLDAVKAGQILANQEGKRVFICSNFGAPGCKPTKTAVPVVYVDPGGLRKVQGNPTGTILVNPVSPAYFQELVTESRGGSKLGWGS